MDNFRDWLLASRWGLYYIGNSWRRRVLRSELITTIDTALTFRGSGHAFKDADTPSFKWRLARKFCNDRRWVNWIEASLFVKRRLLCLKHLTTIVTALTFRGSGLAFEDADTPTFKRSFAKRFNFV